MSQWPCMFTARDQRGPRQTRLSLKMDWVHMFYLLLERGFIYKKGCKITYEFVKK